MRVACPNLSGQFQTVVRGAFGDQAVLGLEDERVEAAATAFHQGGDVTEILGEGWSREDDHRFCLTKPTPEYAGHTFQRLTIDQNRLCLEVASYSNYMGLGVRELLVQEGAECHRTQQEFAVEGADIPPEREP